MDAIKKIFKLALFGVVVYAGYVGFLFGKAYFTRWEVDKLLTTTANMLAHPVNHERARGHMISKIRTIDAPFTIDDVVVDVWQSEIIVRVEWTEVINFYPNQSVPLHFQSEARAENKYNFEQNW